MNSITPRLMKFVQLYSVESKRAPEIAYQLIVIFSIFGAPSILQSDNGRKFVNSGIIPTMEKCELV